MDYKKIVRVEIYPLGGFSHVRILGSFVGSIRQEETIMLRNSEIEMEGEGVSVFRKEKTLPGDYEYTNEAGKDMMRESTKKECCRHIETYWVMKKVGEIGEQGLEKLLERGNLNFLNA